MPASASRLTHDEAVALVAKIAPDFKPTSPYPGLRTAQWRGIHLDCGREIIPCITSMQRGGCCFYCGKNKNKHVKLNTVGPLGYYNVYYHPTRKKYHAHFKVAGDKIVHVKGQYKTAEEAAYARDQLIIEMGLHVGPHARKLNFPERFNPHTPNYS